MTTTELIELLKKHERGGATGNPREVMFEVDGRIIDTNGIEVTGSGDGLISELYLSLPAAQPQRMRGIWECRELNYGAFKTYDFVCSACGKCPPLNYNKEMLLSDFCPNCGADMRGTE